MKIGIGSDHAGYKVKEEIINYLKNTYEVIDYGTFNEESTDYPIYAFKVGESVINNQINFGILICYTGIGMSIACNKIKGIRCAKVDNVKESQLTRMHNNSNVISISALKDIEQVKEIITTFLETDFLNGERHMRRINLIDEYGAK